MNDFYIVDLFIITSSIKKFNAVDLHFVSNGGYPYVARGSENNGIKGYINEDPKYLNKENTISFGQDTATIFFQEKPYFTGDKIKIFTPKFKNFNKVHALYFLSAMRKSFSKFSWGGTSFNEQVLNEVKISLPVLQDNNIDWYTINKTITDLKETNLVKLNNYLLSLGYDNISSLEKSISSFKKIRFNTKDYLIEELFNVKPSKGYSGLSDYEIINQNGKTPYISNQSQSNGLIGYSSLKPINEGNVITVSDTWESERTLFYQAQPFIGKSHLQVLTPLFNGFNKYVALYLISSIRRAIVKKYNYGIKFNRNAIKATVVKLPLTENGDLNLVYMEQYIKHLQDLKCKQLYDSYIST